MTARGDDPFDLQRFVDAQAENYRDALAELNAGRKRTHWMWYVFPQLAGLGGGGEMSTRYAIHGTEEAAAYLRHPVLGPRILECSVATLRHHARSAVEIFGGTDALKLRSSATLFAHVSPPGSVFAQLLERFSGGVPDERTLALLRQRPA